MNKLLRGAGKFVANVTPDSALYAVFVRADRPGSVVVDVDDRALTNDPRIRTVLSGKNISEVLSQLHESRGGGERNARDILALHKPLYLGEPIAVVVATSVSAAMDGAQRLSLELQQAKSVADSTLVDWSLGDPRQTRIAVESADYQFSATLRIPRISATPMEPAGAIAHWCPSENRLVLTAPTQGVHRVRDEICDLLGISADGLRVCTDDVGGAFGARIHALREHAALLLAARCVDAPIVWVADRQESMVAEFHARDLVVRLDAGFERSGDIVALAVDMQTDCGDALSVNYTPIVTQYFAAGVCSAYAIPTVAVTVSAIASPRTPTAAFRGAGHPEGCYVIERVLDEAARGLGLSALAIRQRNLIAAGSNTFTGIALDGINPADTLAMGARKLSTWKAQANSQRSANVRHGFGISLYVKQNGMGRKEDCVLGLSNDGKIVINVGSQSNGQGHEQTFENIAARILEVDPTDVVLLRGDTDALPSGTGTGGSAALTTTGAAVSTGARALREQVIKVAAQHLEVAFEDVRYKGAVCSVAGTDLRIGLNDLAAEEHLRVQIISKGAQAITMTTTVGCHAAWVSVDTQTGVVRLLSYVACDDVGKVLEPELLAAQIHGGVAQGVSQALGEQILYDPDSGQLLTATFMDYWIARADDLPLFDLQPVQSVAASPLGTRGVGEAGALPSSAVVANAVADALHPLAVQPLDLPLTPARVWAALQTARPC